jgi:hypothetical protein
VAYLAADIDRCYARNPLPDYARLLNNIVRWAAKDNLPIEVSGAGLIDCRLYRQDGRLILHLVNLTGTDPRPAVEHIRVGPVTVRIQAELAKTIIGESTPEASLRVSGEKVEVQTRQEWLELTIPWILDHELVVINTAYVE